MMFTLPKSLAAWNTVQFESVFKQEVCALDAALLPLQAALTQSSHVSDSRIEPVVLFASDTRDSIQIKTGIFYSGIIAGSCCADDPGPPCELPEYAEFQFTISKATAEADIILLEK